MGLNRPMVAELQVPIGNVGLAWETIEEPPVGQGTAKGPEEATQGDRPASEEESLWVRRAEWEELGEPEEQVLNPTQAALKEAVLGSRFSQAWSS